MLVRNKAGSFLTSLVSVEVTNNVKDLLKGRLSYDDFWEGSDTFFTKIINSAFDEVNFPFSETFKGFTITQSEPYTMSHTVAHLHGGTVGISELYLKRGTRMGSFYTEELSNGVIIETLATMIISSGLRLAFARENHRRNASKWDAIKVNESLASIRDIEEEFSNFKKNDILGLLIPQLVLFKTTSQSLIFCGLGKKPVTAGVILGNGAEIDSNLKAFFNDFVSLGVSTLKGVTGTSATLEELTLDLKETGSLVEITSDVVALPNRDYYTGELSLELSEYTRNFVNQILPVFGYFIKNSHAGYEMNAEEYGKALYDFGRVLEKVSGKRLDFDVSTQSRSIYELIAAIHNQMGSPLSFEDIEHFIYLRSIIEGDISFTPVFKEGIEYDQDLSAIAYSIAHTCQTFEGLKSLRQYSPLLLEDDEGFFLVLNKGDNQFRVKLEASITVFEPSGFADFIMNADDQVYSASKLLNDLEGLYMAALFSGLTTDVLVNTKEKTFSFRVPGAQLSSQVHPGFLPNDLILILPEV